MDENFALTAALLAIVWFDLMLAGDNAVALAAAAKSLPADKRRLGFNLGALLFLGLRAAVLAAALACARLPGFGVFCAATLLVAALFTARRGEGAFSSAPPHRTVPAMLRAALIQDAPIALTNMLAVQAVAQDQRGLAFLGLGLAFPMLALGASPLVVRLRQPPLIWIGAGLLGWMAGRAASLDAGVALTAMPGEIMRDAAPPVGAIAALLLVYVWLRRNAFSRLPEEEQ